MTNDMDEELDEETEDSCNCADWESCHECEFSREPLDLSGASSDDDNGER